MTSNTSTVIRLATPEDLPEMAKLASLFLKEANLPQSSRFNLQHWVSQWEKFLSSKVGVALIAVKSVAASHTPRQTDARIARSEIIGGIGGFLSDDVFDASRTLTEAFWFLHPDHRGGRLGLRLLDAFEGWARLNDCARIWMIHLTGFNSRLGIYYARKGYSPVETYYFKDL